MSVAMTRGVLFIHSAPTALCPHVEWAIGSVVDKRTDLEWTPQPAATGMFRSELSWTEAVRLDLYYVDNWSMLTDLVIMAKTLRAVLTAPGAY